MPILVPTTLSQQDLLDLFDRILPESYLTPIKVLGPGYELLQAYAKVMARVSTAVGRFEAGSFIIFSNGGSLATGTVEFFRDVAAAGAVTVKQGTVLIATRTGREFVTVEDAIFTAPDLVAKNSAASTLIAVESVAKNWAFNVTGQVTTAGGTVLTGEIDDVKSPLQDPPFGDSTIRVRQLTDFTGGASPFLDQHGLDRGFERNAGETDDQYKARMRALPDTVSPDAIKRALTAALTVKGIAWNFIETFEITYQTCWDAPAATIAGSAYDPNLFAYDDPRDPVPFRNRWLGEEDYRGAFIVTVEPLAAIQDVGMAYDDIALTVADHTTPLGRRAHNAYDIPFIVDTDLILAGAYDGLDIGQSTLFLGLLNMLQEMKAGGVSAIIEKQGQ